ncbi:PhzF family phenazine biosynthesis protein [Photobacterium sp. GJ3]|uniref:PhzF family phenazine biosynthesis protein n=1 Tax=Photobacterium sp. GJ3 TaxID=2829502 RepID=UPI001B8AD290|nr:PhzF family phenazine biosynthesis protein [Photobacterium sp. GJ3]QUJ68972.1 PhzF family phenazine biosynthesis protein [Photobacterium sp. GJ3]
MSMYKVFGQSENRGGNLMAVSEVAENPADSGMPVVVVISASQTADWRFRFFYPDSKEAPICGHALLGAAYHLPSSAFRVETGSGISDVRKDGDLVSVSMSLPVEVAPSFRELPEARWFGLMPHQIRSQGIFSAGKAKWCIQLDTLDALNAVQFDIEALASWNQGKNFSGYILYAITEQSLYARASNPLFNIPEDAACAVCCAALPIALTTPKVVYMGFPAYDNAIHLHAVDGQLWVGGRVFPATVQRI